MRCVTAWERVQALYLVSCLALCEMASVAPELWHTAVYHEQSPSVRYDLL